MAITLATHRRIVFFDPYEVRLTDSLFQTVAAIACDDHNDLRYLKLTDLFSYFVQDAIVSFFKLRVEHFYSIL